MPIISQREYDELLSLKRTVADLENQLESTKEAKEISRLKDKLDEQKEKEQVMVARINSLKDEINVYEHNEKDYNELVKRGVELDRREAEIEAIKSAQAKTVEAAALEDDKKYKSGYEDGVADGLRKGVQIGEEERQNLLSTVNSIATASALSHTTPEAIRETKNYLGAGTIPKA